MTRDDHSRQTLQTDDGHTVHLQQWSPTTVPVGVIQIFHGLGEHGDRYARFANAATARGFVVAVHDHRGHGPQATKPGFFAAQNGWDLLISDALMVNDHLLQHFDGLPLTLLGHSMGSFMAQDFAMRHGDTLNALLLSASTRAPRLETWVGNVLARIECRRLGVHGNSPLLDKLGFGDFNKKFEPARTALDWLSRDEAEVNLYIADPLCGGPYTAGLWRDLSKALFDVAADANIARITADLPILITGGAEDPVGGERGMNTLASHYAQTGHSNLTVKIYPDSRHEMLNETNRDAVTADWLDWIAAAK